MTDETRQPWTPGPWEVTGPVGRAAWIESETNSNIAAMHRIDTPEGMANAKLIAKAPALAEALAALVEASDHSEVTYQPMRDAFERARAELDACGWQWGGR